MQRTLICLACGVEAQQSVDATFLGREEPESEATQHAERAAVALSRFRSHRARATSGRFQKDRSHDGGSDPMPSTGSREPESRLEHVRLVSQLQTD